MGHDDRSQDERQNSKPVLHRRLALAVSRLLEEGPGSFVRIVRRAVLQFALGFAPEFVVPAFGLAGKLPQLVGADPDLFFGRTRHVLARCY